MAKLSPARQFIRPVVGDTLEAIAAQNLASLPTEEAVANMRMWNPHLLARRGGFLLVSDVVFLEG